MPPDVLQTLRDVTVAPRLIEDWCPLTESLEWRLSEQYWNTAGTAGFVQSAIPYTITSSGALSLNAARVLLANCLEDPPTGPFHVLELGAGTGLFARLLIDEFSRLCQADGHRFHEQLVYVVTDRSTHSLAQWRAHGLFADRPALIAAADALDPLCIDAGDGPRRLTAVRAVLCNYSLDSLPSAVLRQGAGGCEELSLRTHLGAEAARPGLRSPGLEEIREMAARQDPGLIPLVTLFEFEAGYRPCEGKYLHAAEALAFGHDWPQVILNHGAIQCLERAIEGLAPSGFVLLNDYGLVRAEDAASMGATQRFGSSAALGLNFPFLAFHFSALGTACLRPDGDDQAPIHARLLTRADIAQTRRAFHRHFDAGPLRQQMEPQERARAQIEAGNLEAAKDSYAQALELRPHDWVLLGEIAEFLIRQVADYRSGHEIAKAALALNPWYSVWLWNVLGDALYAMDRHDEAHDAYRQAQKLEPDDVRTNLNLGYTHEVRGEFSAALQALARGLANDRSGMFRERLMERMQHTLMAQQARHASEQEWHARRAARILSAGAMAGGAAALQAAGRADPER